MQELEIMIFTSAFALNVVLSCCPNTGRSLMALVGIADKNAYSCQRDSPEHGVYRYLCCDSRRFHIDYMKAESWEESNCKGRCHLTIVCIACISLISSKLCRHMPISSDCHRFICIPICRWTIGLCAIAIIGRIATGEVLHLVNECAAIPKKVTAVK